ncbi:MAG: hypothetical protein HRU28_13230 [Rhizobiales bacterium]|nr:hypothetical protein [Hyphomicrobiales bacterium]
MVENKTKKKVKPLRKPLKGEMYEVVFTDKFNRTFDQIKDSISSDAEKNNLNKCLKHIEEFANYGHSVVCNHQFRDEGLYTVDKTQIQLFAAKDGKGNIRIYCGIEVKNKKALPYFYLDEVLKKKQQKPIKGSLQHIAERIARNRRN